MNFKRPVTLSNWAFLFVKKNVLLANTINLNALKFCNPLTFAYGKVEINEKDTS
jgi:hypothetical protein